MTYKVVVTDRAQSQLHDAFAWWASHRSSLQAARWYEAYADAVMKISEAPLRYGYSAENGRFPFEIRNCYFGASRNRTHRIVFTIREQEILIVAVRSAMQKPLGPGEA